jgi:hypothetical protein
MLQHTLPELTQVEAFLYSQHIYIMTGGEPSSYAISLHGGNGGLTLVEGRDEEGESPWFILDLREERGGVWKRKRGGFVKKTGSKTRQRGKGKERRATRC